MNMFRSPWIRGYLTRYKRPLLVALALGFVATAFSLLLMFASGYLISATAQAATTLFAIMVPVAFVQLFGLGKPAARYLERLVSHDWVLRVTSDLRRSLFDALSALSASTVGGQSAGDRLSLLSDDVAHLQNLYLRVVFPAAIGWAVSLGVAIAFGFLGPGALLFGLLALASLAVGVPLVALLVSRGATIRAKELMREASRRTVDDLDGALDWMLSGRQDQAIEANAQLYAKLAEVEAAMRTRQRLLVLLQAVSLGAVGCIVLIMAASAFGTAGGATDPSANYIAAFTLGFLPFVETLTALPYALALGPALSDSVSRLEALSDEGAAPPPKPRPPAAASPDICLQNISYTYPQANRPAVTLSELRIPHGQSVAIVGPSGSGKSTLLNLIRGAIEPERGTASIAQRELAPGEDLSGTVGFIGQNPYLFNRTVRENLAIARPDASDDELMAALESVGLKPAIDTTSQGLDTVAGETGRGFSGGEAHRMAIARVLVADAQIVLVDEPFSALDPATEEQVLETLLRSCAGRTLVVVTHHLSHIEQFDRVLFMQDGKLAMDGPSSQLAAKNETFAALLAFDRA